MFNNFRYLVIKPHPVRIHLEIILILSSDSCTLVLSRSVNHTMSRAIFQRAVEISYGRIETMAFSAEQNLNYLIATTSESICKQIKS